MSDEDDKRDPLLRSAIDDAIEEHEHAKKRQKVTKSVRFSEANEVHEIPGSDEQVADGPIKEHLLEEVYEKRQRGRAEADGADIDRLAPPPDAAQAGPSDVKRVSAADADAEELDGEQLSAFNMEREEAEGFDVETLELRRGRGEEEELAKDPWLASLQQEHAEQEEADDGVLRPKVRRTQVTVSDSVRAKHAAEQAALERSEPLPAAELADARRTLVQHMEARETVMAALTRLGGKRGGKARARVGRQEVGAEEAAQAALVTRLTDAATTLMSEDADVFDLHREELEHALTVSEMATRRVQPAAAAALGSDDDMFADSDEEPPSGSAQEIASGEGATAAAPAQPQTGASALQSGTATAVGEAATAASGGGANGASAVAAPARADSTAGAHAPAEPQVDYASWPVSELKRVLTEAGVAIGGIVDKAGLVEAAAAADKARAQVAVEVPVGFVMDPASGYFHDVETGWYFHGESGCYYRDGKWYSKDGASGAMMELQAPAC